MEQEPLSEQEKRDVIDMAHHKGVFELFRCSHGIVGRVTGGFVQNDKRLVLTGFQEKDPSQLWQSVCPRRHRPNAKEVRP